MEYQYQVSDDDVMMNAPQVHGAPAAAAVIPGTNLPIQSQPTDSTVMRNEVHPADVGSNEEAMIAAGPGKTEMECEMGPADATYMEEAHVAEPMVQISPLMTGLEEDPHSPKTLPAKTSPSNYQAKLTDPTGEGGKEVDVEPILERLDNFHIHNKSQPRDHQANQAQPESMAGKISSATSAIAGKAVSAKDTVASKLGYDKKPVAEVATGYGHKVAEKLAGAGSAVAERGRDGGGSVKEYLAEKLRPGEEDKALSEAITGRFYNKKGEAGAENKEAMMSGGEGSGGGGVVERLKGAVGSWLGKSSGIGLSDGSAVVVEEEIDSGVKLQESDTRDSAVACK